MAYGPNFAVQLILEVLREVRLRRLIKLQLRRAKFNAATGTVSRG